MSSEQIIDQFRQILATLQRIVDASQELDNRVTRLESNSGEALGLMTSIQGNLQVLLESYQVQSDAQNKINQEVGEAIAQLHAKVEALERGAS